MSCYLDSFVEAQSHLQWIEMRDALLELADATEKDREARVLASLDPTARAIRVEEMMAIARGLDSGRIWHDADLPQCFAWCIGCQVNSQQWWERWYQSIVDQVQPLRAAARQVREALS